MRTSAPLFSAHNIKLAAEISGHANWLAEQVNISPVAALRIVLVERQARPTSYLLGPLSSQDVANLREAAGLGGGQQDSIMLSALGTVGSTSDADAIWKRFEDDSAIKMRIFETFLSERRNLMATVDCLHTIKFYQRLPIVTTRTGGDDELIRFLSITEPPQASDTLETYIKLFEVAMNRIEGGLDKSAKDELLQTDAVLLDWTRSALIEVVHALSVIFQCLDAHRSEFSPSALVGEWFSLMEVYAFLNKLEPV